MLIGVVTKDIEFDYRTDDPHGGITYATLCRGDWLKLSNPRIAYFDTTFYDGEIPEGWHKGVILNVSKEEVEIINTAWKKIK